MSESELDDLVEQEFNGRVELSVNLFGIFPQSITYSQAHNPEESREFARELVEKQGRFLERINTFKEHYLNFTNKLTELQKNIVGEPSVRDLRRKSHPIIAEFYKTVDAILNLYPLKEEEVPVLPHHPIAYQMRDFQKDSESLFGSHVRSLARNFMNQTLNGEGPMGKVTLSHILNMRTAELSKEELARTKVLIAVKEPKLYFKETFNSHPVELLLQAVEGQASSYINTLVSMVSSDDMRSYITEAMEEVRHNFLPMAMKDAIHELESIEERREDIFNLKLDPQGRCSMKDEILRSATTKGAPLYNIGIILENLVQLDDDFLSPHHRQINRNVKEAKAVISRVVFQAERSLTNINGIPSNIIEKYNWMRDGLVASIENAISLISKYAESGKSIKEKIEPLFGLVPFDSSGQSDFYTEWFPGIISFLDFHGQVYHDINESYQIASGKMDFTADQKVSYGQLSPIILSPDYNMAGHVPYKGQMDGEPMQRGQLKAEQLCDALAGYLTVFRYATQMTSKLQGVELGLLKENFVRINYAKKVIGSEK